MINLAEIDNKIHLLLKGEGRIYGSDGGQLIADEHGNLKLIVNGIVYDANEEDFGDLLDEDTHTVKLPDTSHHDYYITEVTLFSGDHWYASMNWIGEIVFTREPLLTHWKNMGKLRSCLEMNLAVESFDFKVN